MFSWLRLDTGNSALVHAQLEAYAKLVPVLYLILMVNAATIAITHASLPSSFLTVYIPIGLVLVCLGRLIFWTRMGRAPIDSATAVRQLRIATIAGGALGAMYLAWVTTLYLYGTPQSRAHLSVVVGITGVAGVFGMMHVRPAAVLIAILLALPYSAFLATRSVTEAMIGLNIALAIAGVLYILKLVSADFRNMVISEAETKRLSDENLRLANCDNLTGLPNRRFFFTELDRRLDPVAPQQPAIAVGVIDLDGFKPVNDTYGHVAGDRVLREVGNRLTKFAGPGLLVARLGGDEFAIVVEASTDSELLGLGKNLRASIEEPIVLEDLVVQVSASVGFAGMQSTDDTAADLYERADYALYHAKQHDRGATILFDKSHETAISRDMKIEQALRGADLEAEMSLQFQPVMDVAAGMPSGFEALARWQSPVLGAVSPGEFIPVAERTDRIHAITHCLLRKALAIAATWDERFSVSFNLSVRDLLSPTSVLQIMAIVRKSQVAPSRIDFEVTETALMSDFGQAETSIRLLKALGARVSLDDFGTGYSSLSHVHRLPFDKIKIDRSFVSDIEKAGTSQTIVRSVVDLCRSLDIDCIVEGMETVEQKEALSRLGCKSMQGYYFSRPINASEVEAFLDVARMRRELA